MSIFWNKLKKDRKEGKKGGREGGREEGEEGGGREGILRVEKVTKEHFTTLLQDQEFLL